MPLYIIETSAGNFNGYSVDWGHLKMHIRHVHEAIRHPTNLSLAIKTAIEPILRALRVLILGLK